MRGRKPKPANLKTLHGSRRRPPKAPRLRAVGDPPPPRFLRPEAKREWRRLIADLRGVLVTGRDRAMLAVLASAWADFAEAEHGIRTLGSVIEGRDGGLVKNPWTTIKRAAGAEIVRVGSEFGLSAASRVRLGIPQSSRPIPHGEDDDQPDLEAYLAEGRRLDAMPN